MQFDVLELIGHGSFGNVRKVRRRSDGRLCVRKEILYIKMNPKERSQLIDEFRILGLLSHPNIVEYIYHEHVPEDHMVYLYMEYCDGGDLSHVIKAYREQNEYVPEERVWAVLTQLVMALYRCHYGVDPPPLANIFQPGLETDQASEPAINLDLVVIHRDIKPDNVFLLKDQLVKLGDFGLAKLLVLEHDFATTYVGTPYYMSPEVLSDKPYTPLSDIWSLGCVLYELCSLHPPFQAKTHIQLQKRIKEGVFQSLPEHYSPKLRMTILACITVDVDLRPLAYLLMQEISVKIFRKELELNARESRIRQEQARLAYQNKVLEEKRDELMRIQSQIQQRVEREVNNRVMILLQEPEFMKEVIERGIGDDGATSTKVANYERNTNFGNFTAHSPVHDRPSDRTSDRVLRERRHNTQDEWTGVSAVGGAVGPQNLNKNGGIKGARGVRRKGYYNELYEENTESPFLKTFNSDF